MTVFETIMNDGWMKRRKWFELGTRVRLEKNVQRHRSRELSRNSSFFLRNQINVIGLFANLFFAGKTRLENWPFFASTSTSRIDGGSWIKYVLGKIEFKRVWAGKRERKRDSKCTLSKIAYT